MKLDLLDTNSVTPLVHAYIEICNQVVREDLRSGEPAFQKESDLILRAELDMAIIGDVNGQRILEVGPGYGHLALLMESRGGSVSIADIVPDYMDLIEDSISGDQILLDIQDCDFGSIDKFDVVVMCDVLEHVFRPADALLTAFEALRPGGKLYLRSPANESLIHYARKLGYPFEIVHLRTFTRATLEMELRAAGFELKTRPRRLRGGRYVPRNFFARRVYWERYRSEMESFHKGVLGHLELAVKKGRGRLVQRGLEFLRGVFRAIVTGATPSRFATLWQLTRPLTWFTSRPLGLAVLATKPR